VNPVLFLTVKGKSSLSGSAGPPAERGDEKIFALVGEKP
jgi:hypothetical protein